MVATETTLMATASLWGVAESMQRHAQMWVDNAHASGAKKPRAGFFVLSSGFPGSEHLQFGTWTGDKEYPYEVSKQSVGDLFELLCQTNGNVFF